MILLSARAGEEARIEGLEAGADDYLVKPFSARELLARVDAQVERRRARAKLREATERDRFRASLAEALRRLSDPVEIQAEAMRLLALHLGVERAFYGEVSADGDTIAIERSFHAPDVASVDGSHATAGIGPILLEALRQGRMLAIDDLATDRSLSDEHRAAHRALGIASGVGVPLVRAGRWVGLLGIHRATPHEWTGSERALIEETAERTFAAVERARAEQTLRASEECYRTLFASIDEAFCVCEMLLDEHGKPHDYRFLEVNPAFLSMTELAAPVGRTLRELVPGLPEFWIEAYARVALTGEPVRFEQRAAPTERWFDVYCTRLGDPADLRVAIVFNDITERKQAEEAAARGRPAQGRVPRDARPRAAQSARADPQRARDPRSAPARSPPRRAQRAE